MTETAAGEAAAGGEAAPVADAGTDAGAVNQGTEGSAISEGAAPQNSDGGTNNADASNKAEQGANASEQSGAESDGSAQNDQTQQTPTEYTEFTLPENMEVNDEVMGEFKGLLGDVSKEIGQPLSQDQAQKFVDMGSKIAQDAVEHYVQQAANEQAQRTEKWIKAFQEDADIGGTEDNQNKTLSEAQRVVSALGGEALMNAINETGAGNHPEVIRAFYTLREIVGEDGKVIMSNQGGGGTKTLAATLYPDQKQ